MYAIRSYYAVGAAREQVFAGAERAGVGQRPVAIAVRLDVGGNDHCPVV